MSEYGHDELAYLENECYPFSGDTTKQDEYVRNLRDIITRLKRERDWLAAVLNDYGSVLAAVKLQDWLKAAEEATRDEG